MDASTGVSSQHDVPKNTVTQNVISAVGDDDTKAKQVKENLERYEQLFGADEDAFDQPTTTRKELWSYYLYYNVRDHKTEEVFFPLEYRMLNSVTIAG